MSKPNWYEDESRDEVILWLGKFGRASAMEIYAAGEFCKKLSLPLDKKFQIYKLRTCFRRSGEELRDLIGRLPSSSSYFDAFAREIKKKRIDHRLYNAAIAVFDYRANDPVDALTPELLFVGYFPYDYSAAELVSNIPYLNDAATSVWVGTAKSEAEFLEYFGLSKKRNRRTPDSAPNRFAHDFGIEAYDPEFAMFNYSSAITHDVGDLLTTAIANPDLRRMIVETASRKRLGKANLVYIAPHVDYEAITGPRRIKQKNLEVKFVGTFAQQQSTKKK